jgi:hypothetical protein
MKLNMPDPVFKLPPTIAAQFPVAVLQKPPTNFPCKFIEPVTFTDPVKVCVFAVEFPKRLEPLEYTTEEVTV